MVRFGHILLGMIGIRLDAGRILIPWIALLIASGWLLDKAIRGGFPLEFAVASWAFYYIGMTLILGTGIKRRLIASLGEQRAWSVFQMVLGVMFFSIGSGVSAAALHPQGSFSLSPLLTWVLIVPLFSIGFGVKFWATWVVGMDTYYYRDLFFERSHGEWTAAGPYEWMPNPMYGMGYLHSYCPALLFGSGIGLVFALVAHLSIFGFYLVAELPFIKRTYA